MEAELRGKEREDAGGGWRERRKNKETEGGQVEGVVERGGIREGNERGGEGEEAM